MCAVGADPPSTTPELRPLPEGGRRFRSASSLPRTPAGSLPHPAVPDRSMTTWSPTSSILLRSKSAVTTRASTGRIIDPRRTTSARTPGIPLYDPAARTGWSPRAGQCSSRCQRDFVGGSPGQAVGERLDRHAPRPRLSPGWLGAQIYRAYTGRREPASPRHGEHHLRGNSCVDRPGTAMSSAATAGGLSDHWAGADARAIYAPRMAWRSTGAPCAVIGAGRPISPITVAGLCQGSRIGAIRGGACAPRRATSPAGTSTGSPSTTTATTPPPIHAPWAARRPSVASCCPAQAGRATSRRRDYRGRHGWCGGDRGVVHGMRDGAKASSCWSSRPTGRQTHRGAGRLNRAPPLMPDLAGARGRRYNPLAARWIGGLCQRLWLTGPGGVYRPHAACSVMSQRDSSLLWSGDPYGVQYVLARWQAPGVGERDDGTRPDR